MQRSRGFGTPNSAQQSAALVATRGHPFIGNHPLLLANGSGEVVHPRLRLRACRLGRASTSAGAWLGRVYDRSLVSAQPLRGLTESFVPVAVEPAARPRARTHILDPRWAICPSGGIDKILPFVRLFHGNRLNTVVLTDFDRGQKRKLNDLYRAQLLEDERIIVATEIAGQDEADIEDFFDRRLYVELLNATYKLKGKHRLSARKLERADEGTVRAVKKADAYFRLLPSTYPDFSHFDPAMHLLRNPGMLDSESEAVAITLDRFEAAFARIAGFANWATR